MEMRVLLTNDDGVEAEGLWVAKEVLEKIGEIWIVAPDKDKSGVSHSLTLREPIRVEELRPKVLKVSGTPTDCILLAYHQFVKDGIDLIVAGINHGYNMGSDVFYSGTVAAAIQGGIIGIKAMAVSTEDIESARRNLLELTKMIKEIKDNIVLNVNVPKDPKGYEITKLGKRIYRDEVIKKEEDRHIGYYVIDGTLSHELSEQTDFQAIENGRISITPLNLDLTDHEILGSGLNI